jgi:hypothetical protein
MGERGDFVLLTNDDELLIIPKIHFNKEYQRTVTQSDLAAVSVALQIYNGEQLDVKPPPKKEYFNNIRQSTPLRKVTRPKGQQQKKTSYKLKKLHKVLL